MILLATGHGDDSSAIDRPLNIKASPRHCRRTEPACPASIPWNRGDLGCSDGERVADLVEPAYRVGQA